MAEDGGGQDEAVGQGVDVAGLERADQVGQALPELGGVGGPAVEVHSDAASGPGVVVEHDGEGPGPGDGGDVEVVGAQPHALAELGQAGGQQVVAGRGPVVAERGPSAPSTTMRHRPGFHARVRAARLAPWRAWRSTRRGAEAVATAVGDDLAAGGHAGQGGAGRPLADAEQAGHAHEGGDRQRPVGAEQQRQEHRPGGELVVRLTVTCREVRMRGAPWSWLELTRG